MSRTELISGLAIILALVIAQWPGWGLTYAYDSDGVGVTYLAQNSQPTPATFIVDQKGTIRWAFVDPNYTRRAEPSDLVHVLKALRGEQQRDMESENLKSASKTPI